MEISDQKRGILLYGPGGCGKTKFGRALAGTMKLPLMYLEAARVLDPIKSKSEKRLRRLFEICEEKAPCVLFLGSFSSDARNFVVLLILSLFLSCFLSKGTCNKRLVVIATQSF